MDAAGVLDRLTDLAINARVDGERLFLSPVDLVPADLLAEVRQHKAEIIQELRPAYGDGQVPPLDRPPETEVELRRWMDYTSDPENFERWLAWAMTYTDPAECPKEGP